MWEDTRRWKLNGDDQGRGGYQRFRHAESFLVNHCPVAICRLIEMA